MNIYSILDFDGSDEENPKPKVAPKSSGETKKAPAPKRDIPGKAPDAKKDGKKAADKKPNETKVVTSDDAEGGKENNRGGMGKGKGKEVNRKPANKDKGGDAEGGKRAFDRKSGTGRGREVSRGGRGPYNSGNAKEDALKAEKDPASAEIETDDPNAPVEEAAEPSEPEPETFTMDQFMAKRMEARAKASGVLAGDASTRAVDTKELSSLTEAKEELNDFLAQTKGLKGTDKEKSQRSNSKKTITNVGFKFEPVGGDDRDDRRGGRGGGRGDGRGRGGKSGKGRGRGGPTTVFNTNDDSLDFPAL